MSGAVAGGHAGRVDVGSVRSALQYLLLKGNASFMERDQTLLVWMAEC
jgi:hypothetical protein